MRYGRRLDLTREHVVSEELGTLSSQGATRSVERVQQYSIAPHALWPHLTVPEQIAAWMRTTSTILEPSVGGNVHFEWGDSGDSRGTVMIFDVPKTLAFSWHESAGHSAVRFDLTGDGEATTLRCRHRELSPDQLPSIAAGWHAHLESLAAVLAHQPFDFDSRWNELLPRYRERAAILDG